LPGEETVVEVAYVQRLGADEGALRLSIPTLVAPRYMPGATQGDRTGHGAADPTDRVPDADRISPAIGHVRYGLALDVIFDLGREVTVESPSHSISVQSLEGHRRRVSFRTESVPLDRDLVLLAAGAPGVAAGVVAERKPSDGKPAEGTFALTVVPDLFDGKQKNATRDVVFVVDVSGSMGGVSIVQARTALQLCLRHLREGDRFQVIAFSDSFSTFDRKLVPFTQRTLELADRWVGALQVQGGTEMLEPLLAAVSTLDDVRRDRVVVLLTDGQVGNEAEIVERVTAQANGARVYTFGIGTNTSDLLLLDLARRTRGAAEFIHPGERIDDKVTAQFARATAARIDDVSVRFVDVDAGEMAPAELPALIDGEPWVVYGRYAEAGIGRAEIRGTFRGERFFLEVPVELPAVADRPGLTALWASARIRDLEESEHSLGGRRAEAQKKRIVRLSTEHAVGSKYTSFVVIERRTGDRRAHGQPEARAIPVNAPAGWAMFEDADEEMTLGMGTGMQGRAISFGATPPPACMAPPPPMPSHVHRPSPASPAPGHFFGAPPKMPPPPGGAPRAPSFTAKLKGAAQRLIGGGGPSGPPMASDGKILDAMSPLDESDDARTIAVGAGYAPSSKSEAAPSSGPQMLFGRQLASGLWDRDGTDVGSLIATAHALAACSAEGIDTAHAVYGAQVKKAVEAICRLAKELAARGGAEREVMAALAAAFLVATGRRVRAQVLDVARGAGSASIQALAGELVDAQAARSKFEALSR
jgi:Ca-activated chloride channel family protein